MENDNDKKLNSGQVSALAHEVHDRAIGVSAVERAGGHTSQLKGVVHETLFCEQYNSNPANIISGKHAQLTKSPIAARDDIVVMQKGRVVERFQLKDTPRSINSTLSKVESGQYRGTNLVGTKETAELYTKKAVSKNVQSMASDHISSETTERIANKANSKPLSKNDIQSSAKSAGLGGAVIGAVSEAGRMLMDGKEYSASETIGNVAAEAGGGYVNGYAAALAGEAAASLASSALVETGATAALAIGGAGAAAATAIPVVAGAVVAIEVGKVAAKATEPIVESIKDTVLTKDPAHLKYGVQDAAMEVMDTIEEIPILGPMLQNIGGFFNRLFW